MSTDSPGEDPYPAQQLSNLDMVADTGYPISPPTDDHSSWLTSSIDIRMLINPQTPEAVSSPSYPPIFKRDRTPPKNSKDEIFCDHPDCAGKRETFTRACEWHKHMDKHERPYKCFERGCERLLGFTYRGGLIRHNREVHKKNLFTRTPIYCPFPNCNRNSGSGHGFTRQENLNEHKRRKHPGEEPPATANQALSPCWADAGPKRKRVRVSMDEQESEEDEIDDDETSPPRRASRHGRGPRKNRAYRNWRQSKSDLDPLSRDVLISGSNGNLTVPAVARLDSSSELPFCISDKYLKQQQRGPDIDIDLTAEERQKFTDNPTQVSGIIRNLPFRVRGTSRTFFQDFIVTRALDDVADIVIGWKFIWEEFKLLFEDVRDNFTGWFRDAASTFSDKISSMTSEL